MLFCGFFIFSPYNPKATTGEGDDFMKKRKSKIRCVENGTDNLTVNVKKTAVKVSLVSIIGNAILSAFKLFAGIFAKSGAMISDAVHSASDVLSSIIVIIGVNISSKGADKDHPYGHERFESVSAIVLAVVLFITGLFIGYKAIGQMTAGDIKDITVPGLLALIAAGVSIVVKEAMYWYTRHYAKKINSDALMADAWHHRSDALSSVGALAGILGARLGVPILDPIASLVICLFIAKASFDIFKDAINKMVDHCCDAQTENKIKEVVLSQEGVLGIDLLRTREFGARIYVEVEIRADGNLTLNESHKIAEKVHSAIEKSFDVVKHITVHVNPDTRSTDSEKTSPEKANGETLNDDATKSKENNDESLNASPSTDDANAEETEK